MSSYTPVMIARMREVAPLTLEKARELAAEDDFSGVSYRSIIAKCKTEGIEYQKSAPATKKPKGETKLDIVAAIEDASGVRDLDGLDKAPAATLRRVLAAFTPAGDNDAVTESDQ